MMAMSGAWCPVYGSNATYCRGEPALMVLGDGDETVVLRRRDQVRVHNNTLAL